MPSTVQELASMFLKAIDSQGNVLDMGVVKEVVTALERHPVSAQDLDDLKSTRLGKYVNLVRRAIPDKSLAKRMKTLVIQWRDLAQKSPSTPNGVPPTAPRTTLPLPSATPPPSPGTAHSNKQLHVTQQTPAPSTTTCQSSSQLPPLPPLPPPPPPPPPPTTPRPPSSNPAINRKRALHRLSKFPPQQPQQPQLQKSSQSTSSTSSSLNHPPSSISSSSSSTTNSSLHNPPVSRGKQASSFLTQTNKQLIHSPEGTTPGNKYHPSSSLHVRLPLPSISRSYLVQVPLSSVTVGCPVSSKAEASPKVSTGKVKTSGDGKGAGKSVDSLTRSNGLETSDSRTPIVRSDSRIRRSVTSQSLPVEKERTKKEEHSKENLSLVVSINRDLLVQGERVVVNSTAAPNAQDQQHSSICRTYKSEPSSLVEDQEMKTSSLKKLQVTDTPNDLVDEREYYVKWTEPIIHRDSFAVNILPYVYIDGAEEESEGESVA